MNITNEQIIQSARRQREAVNSSIDVAPWNPRQPQRRGLAAIIAIAASLISFIAGYGLGGNLSQDAQPQAQPILTQAIQIQRDTIYQTQTVRDTIYQTRIVTKHEPMLAANEEKPVTVPTDDIAQDACSMLCDNIPYNLLATPGGGF